MVCILRLSKVTLLFVLFFFVKTNNSNAQTIRYQNGVRGGFAVATNCLVNNAASPTSNGLTTINTAGGVTMSSYSDLVLPSGSTIVKAFLYVEGYAKAITSVKFRVPGAPGYTTLTSASAGFIAAPSTGSYSQFIIDVTALMPASGGFVSTVMAGGSPTTNGRYSVADLSTFDSANYGYGWSLFVVYSNPTAKFRNVTIADACKAFGLGTTTTFDINNISVPSSGTVNAVVAATGCWGDVGALYGDNIKFGKKGGTLTALKDPITLSTTDVLNSTIGFAVPNNVTVDGVTGMTSGIYTARKPYNTFGAGAASSYFYDCDLMDASGILAPSATPISVTITQAGSGSDALGTGAYAVSIDIASASVSKSLSPTVILDGDIATYTFNVSNAVAGGINLTGIGFKDNLPSGIVIANPANASITGGSGGLIAAVPGTNFITLSLLNLAIGQTAVMKVDVTNVTGQYNPDCAANPLAFTNGFGNIVNNTANLANGVSPQCLIVTAPVPIKLLRFSAKKKTGTIALSWTTLEETNAKEFVIEKNTGTRYVEIGSIPASGNSTTTKNYLFEDKNPSGGANYYRLKQVDFDGANEYSKVVSATIAAAISEFSVISSAEGNNIIDVSYNAIATGNSTIKLFDIAGREIKSLTVSSKEGFNTHQIDISDLNTGVYILNINDNNGYSENMKMRK